ncbi:MAG: hypothetical protein MJ214_00015 [Bacilli bacterium]|nr:hypothetical protein [Bacilli bacterium]
MDPQKALETIAKLHQERDEFHKKKVKTKKRAIVCLIIGLIFLVAFIVTISITLNNMNFTAGMALFIVFAVIALIFLEGAIIFFVLSKCVYAYQEENRQRILDIINKKVNENKSKTNE